MISKEIQTALKTAEEHILKNRIKTVEGASCVDGRYNFETNGIGGRAIPGAHLGYVLPLLALNLPLSPEKRFDRIYNAVTRNGEKFYLHTDEHAETGHALIGCGHIAKAANPQLADSYGVNHRYVIRVVDHVMEKLRGETTNIRLVTLRGEHREQAVLINSGLRSTISHSDSNGMYFVYDRKRNEEFMTELIPQLDIPNATLKTFSDIYNKQLKATLHYLAQGKPIFEFDADQHDLTVTFKGTVS